MNACQGDLVRRSDERDDPTWLTFSLVHTGASSHFVCGSIVLDSARQGETVLVTVMIRPGLPVSLS